MTEPPPVACFREPDSTVGWALRELQCPSDATVAGVYLVAAVIVVSVAWRLHSRGLSEAALRGVIGNACAIACCVTPAWLAAYGLGMSGEAAVGAAVLGALGWWASSEWVVEETVEMVDVA